MATIACVTVALVLTALHRWSTSRRLVKRLERARTDVVALAAAEADGDAGRIAELRQGLELRGALVKRAILAAPVEENRLSFFESSDRHPFLVEDGVVPVLDNFLAPRSNVRESFLVLVDDALAHHRHAMRSAWRPGTWLGWVLFLPRELLSYLHLHTPRTRGWVTWLQIVYWVGGVAWIVVRVASALGGSA